MGRITVFIPDDIERTFRLRVLKLRGSSKGVLGSTVTEALELWIKEHPDKPP